MFRNILVPLDGSELSEFALPYAAAIAGPLNATLHLLQVVASANDGSKRRVGIGPQTRMPNKTLHYNYPGEPDGAESRSED